MIVLELSTKVPLEVTFKNSKSDKLSLKISFQKLHFESFWPQAQTDLDKDFLSQNLGLIVEDTSPSAMPFKTLAR